MTKPDFTNYTGKHPSKRQVKAAIKHLDENFIDRFMPHDDVTIWRMSNGTITDQDYKAILCVLDYAANKEDK